MSVAKAKSAGAGIGVGLLVGWYVYQRKSAADLAQLRQGVCASAPPGSLQTLSDAIKGAKANFLEDGALAALGLGDLLEKIFTLGLVQGDGAAQFYSWWHGLTPEQQAQVKLTEDGNLVCAAAETGAQVKTGTDALTTALLSGGAAYLVASAIVGD